MIFRIVTRVVHNVVCKVWEFIIVWTRDNNRFTHHFKITLNIGRWHRRITNSNYEACISITIPLAKQVQPCEMFARLPLFFIFLELLILLSNEKLLCHYPCSMQYVIKYKKNTNSSSLPLEILKSVPSTFVLYRVAQKERNSRYSRFSELCSNQQLLSSLCWIEHLFPIIITSRSSNLVENFLFYETFLMDCHFRDLPNFQSFEARWQINGKSQKWQSIRNYS